MHVTKTFRDLGVHDALCQALEQRGITHPFPIQELTLPLALEGNDLIGQARTGTGKTLAFGLPLLQRIDPSRQVTQALVVTPTRELANQVHDDLSIGEVLDLSSVVVYGGVPYEEQIEALRGGAHVVVGTPGRLLDHLNRGNLDLSQVTQLVLDEADEMLDMGFLPDVERLIEASTGVDRHTMLFSATMPTAIVRLARRYMHHPTFTRADHEEKHTAPEVTQHFFQVHRMDKPRVLARILQTPDRGGVYVFVRTKHMADRLVEELAGLGTPAVPIHGDLRQSSREQNLDRFRSGKATVLVATEVAARGLDVSGVSHVVNYDCPDDEKMYLHRIGRTARAGASGVAITFAEFNEADRLNVIRKAVGATESEVLPVFSTSPELTALFDLPDEKPWDAMVRDQVDEYHEQRGGRGRPTSRSDRPERRTGRTDGRPKNERAREGSRDRQSGRRGPDRGPQDTTERGGDADQARVRTRTRSRSRTGADSGEAAPRSGDQRAGEGRRRARPGDGKDRAERARDARPRDEHAAGPRGDRATDRRRSDADQGSAPGGRGGDDDRSKGGRNDDRGKGGDQRARAKGGAGQREREPRPSDANGAGRSGNDRGGRAGGERSRGKRGSRGGDRRSSEERDTARTLAQRGAEARGEGQPHLARRVKVEKLP